jgi:CRISPR/Cas system CMR-associated protein Cmr5 small subunit
LSTEEATLKATLAFYRVQLENIAVADNVINTKTEEKDGLANYLLDVVIRLIKKEILRLIKSLDNILSLLTNTGKSTQKHFIKKS